MYQEQDHDVFKYLERRDYEATSFSRVLFVIFFFGIAGAIIYFLYNKRRKEKIISEDRLNNKIYLKPYLIEDYLSYDENKKLVFKKQVIIIQYGFLKIKNIIKKYINL